jgi:hypothetical protein
MRKAGTRQKKTSTGAGGARVSSGTGSKQDYRTPADFMAAVVDRFGPISFDLAAHAENKQSPNYFAPCTGPEGPLPLDKAAFGTDAFDHPWGYLSTSRFRRDGFPGLLWLNCEFNDIPRWAKRCRDESCAGANILLLTPASVGANWFSDLIAPWADTYILKPRLEFIPGQVFPKDCMLSHFVRPDFRHTGPYSVKGTPDTGRILEIWNWKKSQTVHQWHRDV